MYALLWRLLPGPPLVKAMLGALLALAVVLALFSWVFPAVEPLLPFNQVVVETPG